MGGVTGSPCADSRAAGAEEHSGLRAGAGDRVMGEIGSARGVERSRLSLSAQGDVKTGGSTLMVDESTGAPNDPESTKAHGESSSSSPQIPTKEKETHIRGLD